MIIGAEFIHLVQVLGKITSCKREVIGKTDHIVASFLLVGQVKNQAMVCRQSRKKQVTRNQELVSS